MQEAQNFNKNAGNLQDASAPILFNVAESRSKLLIYPPDFLLVEADETDSRNKKIYLKNEEDVYTLMNVSFGQLQNCVKELIQVNKHTLLSPSAVHYCEYDIITLRNLFKGWDDKQVVLSRAYHYAFYARLNLKRI